MKPMNRSAEAGWNALLVLSLVAILAATWYGYAKPTDYNAAVAGKKQVARVLANSRQANDQADADAAVVRNKTWNVSQDALGSVALARLTQLAEKYKLQLSGFRTERSVEAVGVLEAPFVVTLEGTFPDLLAFVQRLEDPESKLAVNLLQVSTSDAVNGRVIATMGLVGFTLKEGI